MGCVSARPEGQTHNSNDPKMFVQPKTREELYKLRREFWDTRTTNSRSVWLELKRAQEVAFDGDVGTAQMLMQALECTPWTEDASKTYRYTFDSHGRQYNVPMYIFKDPDNLLDDIEIEISVDEDDFVCFKIRPSNFTEDLTFERPLNTRVHELKKDICEELKIDSNEKNLRLFYQGKKMEDMHTLAKPYRVKKDMVIQAFISEKYTE